MTGWLSEFSDPADQVNIERLQAPNRPAPKPSAFQGFGEAVKDGLMAGGAGVARAGQLAVSTTFLAQDVLAGVDPLGDEGVYKQYMDTTEPFIEGAEDYWKIDSENTGTAGQIAGGLSRIVLPLMAGAGNPTLLASSETAITSTDALDAGATSGQAVGIGLAQGAAVAVGAKIPVAFGKTLGQKVATGAAANAGLGVAVRGVQSAIAGDNEQLSQMYDPMDGTSLAVDLGIGATFGAIAGLAARRRAAPLDQQDAVAAAEVEASINSSMPDPNARPRAAQAHRTDLDAATRALQEGAPVQPRTVLPEDSAALAAFAAAQDAPTVTLTADNPSIIIRPDAAQPPVQQLSPVKQNIATAAEQAGIDPTTALVIGHIETGGRFNADAQNPKSSANGLFQVIQSSWDRLGGGNRADPAEQIRVGLLHMKKVEGTLTSALGRKPALHESYMGHLLGAGGARIVLTADPNARLYDVVLGYTKAKTQAQRVKIAQDTVNNNGMRGLTVGEAIAKWQAKTDQVATQYRQQSDTSASTKPAELEAIPTDQQPTLVDESPAVDAPALFDEAAIARDRSAVEQQYADDLAAYESTGVLRSKTDVPSLLDRDQWINVRTPAFKRWFGDWENESTYGESGRSGENARPVEQGEDGSGDIRSSDIGQDPSGSGSDVRRAWRLDSRTGEPRIYYHGTKDSIDAFDLSHPNRKDHGWLGTGVYTDSSASIATRYSKIKKGSGEPKTLPLFVAVKNPFVADGAFKQTLRLSSKERSSQATQALIAAGYDGVLLKHGNDYELVAFNPAAVKSAAENTGAYDPKNPNIRDARPAQPDPSPSQQQPDTPEQAAAQAALIDNDIEMPTGELDADGNPIMMSGREALALIEQETATVQEQTTATQAAISCALSRGL